MLSQQSNRVVRLFVFRVEQLTHPRDVGRAEIWSIA